MSDCRVWSCRPFGSFFLSGFSIFHSVSWKGNRTLIHEFVDLVGKKQLPVLFCCRVMASLPGEGSPPLSIRHGVRVVADPRYTVEQVLSAIGHPIGHENFPYCSRMSRAVVAFLSEERLVHRLVERGLVLKNLVTTVSPLFVSSTWISM